MTRGFASILITGASSGLGAALAQHYAAPGIRLALHGRDQARLDAVAAACRGRGAVVAMASIDVTDHAALASWIEAMDDARPLDLVIANAGISGGSSGIAESEAQARLILAVNIDGVLATLYPALARMRPRRTGTIALMSSLAGFRGLPGAPAYGASKAAIRVLGESLRPDLAADGIALSVICPGFVTTPMTARNDFHMPFLISAERAARIIARGLARNRGRIAFPWQMTLLATLLPALPPDFVDQFVLGLPRKQPIETMT